MRTLKKSPAVEERLVVALDTDSPSDAIRVVDAVKEKVVWYKVRQHLLFDNGERGSLVSHLKDNGLSILADFQSATTPTQLEELVHLAFAWELDAISIKTDAYHMQAAVSRIVEAKISVGVVSPVLLTQMGVGDAGFESEETISSFIAKQSERAVGGRLNGVITSCREIPHLPVEIRRSLVFITPGIRDDDVGLRVERDNQKRTCTITEALKNGSDYLLIGRPLILATNPADLAERCISRMTEVTL